LLRWFAGCVLERIVQGSAGTERDALASTRVALGDLQTRVAERRLHVGRAGVEQDRREGVPEIVDTQVGPTDRLTKRLPVDASARVVVGEPAAVGSGEQQIVRLLAFRGGFSVRAQRVDERDVAGFVTLGRLLNQLAMLTRAQRATDVDDTSLEVDVADAQRGRLPPPACRCRRARRGSRGRRPPGQG